MSRMNEGKLDVFGDTCIDYADNIDVLESHNAIAHGGFLKLSASQNNISVLSIPRFCNHFKVTQN